MGTFPVLQKGHDHQPRLPNHSLPTFYMSDYSRLGFRVGRLQDALEVVEEKNLVVIKEADSFKITIDDVGQLHEILKLFKQKGIDCEITDLVDQIYQG
jgi:hypothetical protein